MSGHADTIRQIAAQSERWARYDDVMAPGLDAVEELRKAADALDALLAENQRYEKALREIDHYSHMGDGVWDAYLHVKTIAAKALAGDTE